MCSGEEGTASALSLQQPLEETWTNVMDTTRDGQGSHHFSMRSQKEKPLSHWIGPGKLHCTSPKRKANVIG